MMVWEYRRLSLVLLLLHTVTCFNPNPLLPPHSSSPSSSSQPSACPPLSSAYLESTPRHDNPRGRRDFPQLLFPLPNEERTRRPPRIVKPKYQPVVGDLRDEDYKQLKAMAEEGDASGVRGEGGEGSWVIVTVTLLLDITASSHLLI